jgi:hypothetical protein
VVANGGIYLWKDGRQNWDTMTAVFDYGPLDDLTKASRFSIPRASPTPPAASRSSTTPTAA